MSDDSDVEMKNTMDGDELTDEVQWRSCNEIVSSILSAKTSPGQWQTVENDLLHLSVTITRPGKGLFDERSTKYRLRLSSSQPRVNDYVHTWRILVAVLTRRLLYEVAVRPQEQSVIFDANREDEIQAFRDALETSETVGQSDDLPPGTRTFRWDVPLFEGPSSYRAFVTAMTLGLRDHANADDAFDERTFTLRFEGPAVVTVKLERFRDDPQSTQAMDIDEATDMSFSSVYGAEVQHTEDICRRLLNSNLVQGGALYAMHITSPFNMAPPNVADHPNVQEYLWYVFRVAALMAWPVLIDGDVYNRHLIGSQRWTRLGPAFPIVFYELAKIGQFLWVFQPWSELRPLSEALHLGRDEGAEDSSDVDLFDDLETRLSKAPRKTVPDPKKFVLVLSDDGSSDEAASDEQSPDSIPTLTMTDADHAPETNLLSIFDDIRNQTKTARATRDDEDLATIPPLQDRDSPRPLHDAMTSAIGPVLPLKRQREDHPKATTAVVRDVATPFLVYSFLDDMAEQLWVKRSARLVAHQCVIEVRIVRQNNHVLLEFTNLSLGGQLNNDSSLYCFFRALMQRITLPLDGTSPQTERDPYAALDGIVLSAVAMGMEYDQRFRRIGFTVNATAALADRSAQWLKPIAPQRASEKGAGGTTTTILSFFRTTQFGVDEYLSLQFVASDMPMLQMARAPYPAKDIVLLSDRDTRHFDTFARTVAQTCSTLGNREMLLLKQQWPSCIIIDRLRATEPGPSRFVSDMLVYIIALARIMSWPIYVNKKANADVVDYLEQITYRRPVWYDIANVDYYCWVPKYEPTDAEDPRTLLSSHDLVDDDDDDEQSASKKLKKNDVVFQQCAHCERREARFRAGHLFLCGQVCYSKHFGV